MHGPMHIKNGFFHFTQYTTYVLSKIISKFYEAIHKCRKAFQRTV